MSKDVQYVESITNRYSNRNQNGRCNTIPLASNIRALQGANYSGTQFEVYFKYFLRKARIEIEITNQKD